MKAGVAARRRAAEVVTRVMEDGAHSNILLAQPVDLDPQQRATAQRLALDTLRRLPRLDPALSANLTQPLSTLDPEVRSVLRVAAAELLEGGDAHGIVDSAVESVKAGESARASGLVNAVLRGLTRGGFPPLGDDATSQALATGTPPWIRGLLVAAWGDAEADAFLGAALEPAPLAVRLRPGADRSIAGEVPGIPDARLLDDRRAVDGSMSVMDPSSLAAVQALAVVAGDTVLDMAMAPGNKTAAIADALGGSGRVVAADLHARRTASAARRFSRIGVDVDVVVADGRRPPFRRGSFDRILLDAPCTGLGTLRRRPEIKLRLDPEAPGRMAEVQRAMLEAAVPLLRPGGRLVYSVCTVFPEETTDLVDGFGAAPPEGIPGGIRGDGRLLAPHLTGTDGMFIAVIDG